MGNVAASPDACVHLKDWLMEIFKGVMTAASSSSPLQNYRESWVGLRNIDDLLDSIDRAVLKGYVFQPDCLNVLVGNLDRRYPGANSQPFNRNEHLPNEGVGEVGSPIP